MTPPRRRQVRLVVSLGVAVALAAGLVYTSFSAASPALTPSQLLRQGASGRVYQLTGTVVRIDRSSGGVVDFRLADRTGDGHAVTVDYTGTVPDAFREGRELIVSGSLRGGTFVAQPGSMITKCPSKYSAAPPGNAA